MVQLTGVLEDLLRTTGEHETPGDRLAPRQGPAARTRSTRCPTTLLALWPADFTSRDLRHYLGPQLGKTLEDMTSGQISYDLRRLRAHQIIGCIPHSRA